MPDYPDQRRTTFIKNLDQALSTAADADEAREMIQALLILAATRANAMSKNTVGFAVSHVNESASQMAWILEDTFDITIAT